MLLSHTQGSHIANLIKFRPVVYEETDSRRTDKRTDGGVHNVPVAFFFQTKSEGVMNKCARMRIIVYNRTVRYIGSDVTVRRISIGGFSNAIIYLLVKEKASEKIKMRLSAS